MIRILTGLLLSFCSIVFAATPMDPNQLLQGDGQWLTYGNANFSQDSDAVELQFTQDGTPFAVGADHYGELQVFTLANKKWVSLANTPGYAAPGYPEKFALNQNGIPMFANAEYRNSHYFIDVYQYDFIGKTWKLFTPFPNPDANYQPDSFVITMQGKIYLAMHNVNLSKETIETYDVKANTWNQVGNIITLPPLNFITLKVDANGNPFIYMTARDDNTHATIQLMKYDNMQNQWVNLGALISYPPSNNNLFSTVSMAFGLHHSPYIAYLEADGKENNNAVVKKLVNGQWQFAGIANFIPGGARGLSNLTIAPDGQLYIAYENPQNHSSATVMAFNGKNWVNVGDANFCYIADDGGHMEAFLAIHPGKNNPYFFYEDALTSTLNVKKGPM